jgi:glycine/D-amino acid oxidase-like deaminating enzyme
MPTLLVVGAGLFGSQAAAYARSRGHEALVFDPGLPGAASPAAAGLFKEEWAGKKRKNQYHDALPVLDGLYGIRSVNLTHDDGTREPFLWVPPSAILEPAPLRQFITSAGDGWLEAGGQRFEGWVYIAAGIWCERFLPGLAMTGKAGAAFHFQGEREGRVRRLAHGRQALAFVRDAGTTYFSDGTAEREYTLEHEKMTLERAADFGLTGPVRRYHGYRPYTSGGPVFTKLGRRTWLATGGRKMGTILGASFARRLVDEEVGG